MQDKRLELRVRVEEPTTGERVRGALRMCLVRARDANVGLIHELLLKDGEDGRALVGVSRAVCALGLALGTARSVDGTADNQHVRP